MTLQPVADLAFHNVEGWLSHLMVPVIEFADQHQRRRGVAGDIAEIGVHHGLMFFMLASCAREDEAALAIDLFEDQALNVDGSGNGAGGHFDRNLENLFPNLKSRVRKLAADSMGLSAATLRGHMASDGLRLFSVDGGHNIEHVLNDLSLAQDLVSPGGIVFLDDFFGRCWPSVTEGTFRYFDSHNRRLAPFLIHENKLMLTTYSEHRNTLDALHDFMRDRGDNMAAWLPKKLFGFDIWTRLH
jgi:hypothetical protein